MCAISGDYSSIKNDPTKLRIIFWVCCMVHPLDPYLCSGALSRMCYVPGDGRVSNRVTDTTERKRGVDRKKGVFFPFSP